MCEKFQLLLHSQPVGLGLLVGLQTSTVEHPADILEDVHDVAVDAFQVLPLIHRANFFSGFPVLACDSVHLIQQHNLMRCPGCSA